MKRPAACTLAALVQLLVLVGPVLMWGDSSRLLQPATLLLLATLGYSMLAEASVASEVRVGSAERGAGRLAQATGGGLLGMHVLAVSGWGAWNSAPGSMATLAAGAAMVLCGAALRRSAVQALGQDFRSGWSIRDEQKLITTGPFAWSRHPSELGLLVAALGVVVLSANVACAAVAMLVLVPLTATRILAEERALRRGFGPAYTRYASRTPALVGWPRSLRPR